MLNDGFKISLRKSSYLIQLGLTGTGKPKSQLLMIFSFGKGIGGLLKL